MFSELLVIHVLPHTKILCSIMTLLIFPGYGWRYDAQYIPPFHIAADRHGDLGARLVDVNGDGAADLVFHRWINSNNIQKGAYLGKYKPINFVFTHTHLPREKPRAVVEQMSTNLSTERDIQHTCICIITGIAPSRIIFYNLQH